MRVTVTKVWDASDGASREAALKARIAELEAAVREVLQHRVGDLPREGWIKDTDTSRAAIARLAKLVPYKLPD